MKKVVIAGLIASILFAARYPIAVEYYYMNSCVNAGKNNNKSQMIEYCACTLGEIEKNYTLSEFITNMQTNKDVFLKELSKKIIPQCITKLSK